MRKVKVAMMQMNVVTDDWKANLSHAEALLKQVCRDNRPDFAVFPETSDIGWATASAEQLADAVPGGNVCEGYRRMAKECEVYVVAGLTERDGDAIYNCAVFFSPSGELLAKHRKINVLQDVEGMYSIGDQLHVVHTEFGRIGFDICADNFVSNTVLLHTMGRMGAQMVLSPSAWAVTENYDNTKNVYGDIWKVPYRKLSKLYGMPIVGVSNVGKMESGIWAGHDAIGNSMAFDANGDEIIVLPFGVDKEVVHVIEVSLQEPIAKGTDFAETLLKRGYTGWAEETGLAPKGHGDGSVLE